MNITRLWIPALCILLQTAVQAQPHIQGHLHIDMSNGLIDCRFRISHITARQYKILLYRGMNIKYFKSDTGEVMHYAGYYDGKNNGEAMEYTLMKNAYFPFTTLPQSFSIEYRGAFPIYHDTLNSFDFKGYIAWNGKTLRASEQSKWYPVIYDIGNDRFIDHYTYDITVTTNGAKTVFLNGCPPQQQPVARFSASSPQPLLLFAGDYDFIRVGNDYVLNAAIDTLTAQAIFRDLQKIKAFYVKQLNLPYGEGIYLLSHKAVEPFNPGRSWGFTTFPSFAFAGLDFKKLITAAGTLDQSNTAFFAHELAHFYFKSNNGPLMWFWVESGAEYLSLKAVEKFTDTAFYHQRLRRYVKSVKEAKYAPLARITKANDIDNNYRYMYGPLLLWCFEQQFGQKATYGILADVIKQSGQTAVTLDVFKQIALRHGIGEAEYNRFFASYLDGDQALTNTCTRVTATIH